MAPNIDISGSIQNPAFSPDGKSLAFTRFRLGYNKPPADVYMVDLTTGALTTVANDGAENVSEPGSAWHPIGGLIFSSDRGSHDEIWRWRGGVLDQITSRAASVAWEPTWAPDGRSIAFESHGLSGEDNGQIVTVELGTSNYMPLTQKDRDCRQPNWSPDGKWIVFQENIGSDVWQLRLLDMNDRVQERVLVEGTDATFSPDSARVVYSDNDGRLATISINGGLAERVGGTGYQGAPSWSPDGQTIACEASASDPDGGPGTKIAFLPAPSATAAPSTQPPSPSMPQITGADIIAKARSYKGKFTDGPDVVTLARTIGQRFPDLAQYCTEASNTMPWCGDFVAYVLSDFGIRPPPVVNGVGFFWVDRWLDFGTPVPVGQEQPGDVAIFKGSPHHVTFVAGGGMYVGGNQSDAVTEAHFRTPDAIRRPSTSAVQPAPSAPPGTSTGAGARFTGITATVFGGSSDPNNSAYDNHFITDSELGVALPFRFPKPLPKVQVWGPAGAAVCDIVDVGPWNTNDPYWQSGRRPEAESGVDNTGRRTNLAGIDLTPAAARQVGINGKGKVDWAFVTDAPVPAPQPQPSTSPPALDPRVDALIVRVDQLTAQLQSLAKGQPMPDTPAPASQPAPQFDPAKIDQIMQALATVTTTLAQVTSAIAKKQAPDFGAVFTKLAPLLIQGGIGGGGLLGILTANGALGSIISSPTAGSLWSVVLGALASGIAAKFTAPKATP